MLVERIASTLQLREHHADTSSSRPLLSSLATTTLTLSNPKPHTRTPLSLFPWTMWATSHVSCGERYFDGQAMAGEQREGPLRSQLLTLSTSESVRSYVFECTVTHLSSLRYLLCIQFRRIRIFTHCISGHALVPKEWVPKFEYVACSRALDRLLSRC